jgi:hypothetical protein
VAEELHRHRVLVRMHAQELAVGALVAVFQAEARHHLAHGEPRAIALGLQPNEPVADPGQRRKHDAVGQLDAAERPGCGERVHAENVTRG